MCTRISRDAFSLLHFPMMLGVIAYAVAIEEAALHPDEALSVAARAALAVGLLLFVGGMAAVVWRASSRILLVRLLLILLTAAIVLAVGGYAPAVSFGIGLLGLALILIVEQFTLPAPDDGASQEI